MTTFNAHEFEERVRKDMYTRKRNKHEMQKMIDGMHGVYQRIHQNELLDKGLAFMRPMSDGSNRFIVSYDGELSLEEITSMPERNGIT